MEPYFEGSKLKDKSESFHIRRIFISNIPFNVSDIDLKEAFSVYGHVESAYRIVTSNQEKKPFGFILFQNEQSAIACHQRKVLRIKGVSVCCRFFKKREEIAQENKQTYGGKKKAKPILPDFQEKRVVTRVATGEDFKFQNITSQEQMTSNDHSPLYNIVRNNVYIAPSPVY
jgi:RNA recognition motif-containing protein